MNIAKSQIKDSASWEIEIGKIVVGDQPRQKVRGTHLNK
jgi:hypothetical protein